MKIEKNIILPGVNGKPIALDIFYQENDQLKPIVIYAHGFNGFKDWANFDIIARQFATAGFVFVKFNFSHNGTTPNNPETFVDLDAFGENNYSKELEDLSKVIDWCMDSDNLYASVIITEKLYLVGHSMGGGIVLIKSAEDTRVKKVATWASISECKTPWGSWAHQKMEDWKTEGVQYIANGRTGQQMPLYYQLYIDYETNKSRLNIQHAIASLHIPILICHGTTDDAVSVDKAKILLQWQPNAQLLIVDSDHVFGRKHPWVSNKLPEPMQAVLSKTIEFYLN